MYFSTFVFHPLGLTVFESAYKKPDKRQKVKGGDAGDIDNYLGPWAKYVDEKSVAKPTEVMHLFFFCIYFFLIEQHCDYKLDLIIVTLQEEKKELDEITAKRQKRGRKEEEAPAEEKTILHGAFYFWGYCDKHFMVELQLYLIKKYI